MMHCDLERKQIVCSEVWGGVRNADLDVVTSAMTASLYSRAASGARGGDMYYVTVCQSDTITRIAVADVEGHGDGVSEMSAWMYDALVARMNEPDSSSILGDLNRAATERRNIIRATAAVLSFRTDTRSLCFSYAGHPPIWVRRRRERVWRPLRQRHPTRRENLPLGFFPEGGYEQDHIRLESGDRLLVYTDGLLDAPSRDETHFGDVRLHAVLERAGEHDLPELKQAVVDNLLSHTSGSLDHDDVTLMAIEVH